MVWLELWDKAKGKDEEAKKLSEYARAWLKRTLNKTDGYRGLHPGWSYVWQQFIEDSPDDKELLQLGCDWLEVARDDDERWGVVWPILWEQAKDQDENAERNDKQISLAERWLMLTSSIDNPEWPYKCDCVLNHGKFGPGLLEKCRQWLEKNKDHYNYKGIWSFIYKLLKYHMTDEEKELIANNLFADPRWPYVWKAMWNPEKPEHRLEEYARNWLDQNMVDQSGIWGAIWVNIWDSKPRDEKMKNL